MDSPTLGHVLYDMAWAADPTAWAGLLTLAAIETVLGIDNLLFIAILSQKLPPKQRDKARYLGIGGALLIRIVLMLLAAYMVAITTPLFSLFGLEISIRDVVMFAGGFFLLYKSTVDLHAKLEGDDDHDALTLSRAGGHSLLMVAVQITVLDAIFSVDAIITAVGMTEHVFIMIFAVCIAMGIMTWASGLVTELVIRHPTLVILCLGFLLLIGFSLVMESLHLDVPKGYLYAAIGFSILIEILNEIARRNVLRLGHTRTMQNREIAANLVLRLLGSKKSEVQSIKEAIVSPIGESVFNNMEQDMVARVLQLSSLPIKAVMTSRTDLEMLKLDVDPQKVVDTARRRSRSNLVAYLSGQKDAPLGYIKRADVLALALGGQVSTEALRKLVQTPLYLPETVNILKALDEFRKATQYIAFVFDEFGNFEGMVTLHDIMEEVAGELPDQTEVPEIVRSAPGEYRVEAEAALNDVERITGFSVPQSEHYHTLAGFLLDYLQRLPEQGEVIKLGSWQAQILKSDSTSIEVVRLTNLRAAKKGATARQSGRKAEANK
ncbi:MAG: CBS domain-containing protein [Succinivibrio sp.]|nr:CBS domain-containing protein [Succinivibrio sp.]